MLASVPLAQSLCCFAPDVAVVQTADTGKPGDLRAGRKSRLERPPVRRIPQPRMNSFSVVQVDNRTLILPSRV